MTDAVLYHNPRCSKSREALDLLRAHGIEPRIRDYLREPPGRGELLTLKAALDLPPRQWMREGEDAFAELGLAGIDDEERLIDAIVAHPRLLQRPILLIDGKARIGRPPERLLELLPPGR